MLSTMQVAGEHLITTAKAITNPGLHPYLHIGVCIGSGGATRSAVHRLVATACITNSSSYHPMLVQVAYFWLTAGLAFLPQPGSALYIDVRLVTHR